MLRKTLVTAERSADVMRADARREAERIVREAEQTAREIVGEAHHERERVRHEIIRLTEKEREFRARFRAMLTATSRDHRVLRGGHGRDRRRARRWRRCRARPPNTTGDPPPGGGLADMDGTLVDSRVVVERHWRLFAAHGLDAGPFIAAGHGRRTSDVLRELAPHLDAAAEAARSTPARRPTWTGSWPCRARRSCSPRSPAALGRRDLGRTARWRSRGWPRSAAGARRDGVRRRDRARQARSGGLPARRRSCSASTRRLPRARGRAGRHRRRAGRGRPGGRRRDDLSAGRAGRRRRGRVRPARPRRERSTGSATRPFRLRAEPGYVGGMRRIALVLALLCSRFAPRGAGEDEGDPAHPITISRFRSQTEGSA